MAVAETWEDLLDELEEPTPAASPAAAAAKPAAAGKKAGAATPKGFAAENTPLSDPISERLRRQKLVEENEKRLMDDLFADCDQPDGTAAAAAATAAAAAAESKQRAALAAKAAKTLAS
ncbi:hypothetical protein, conserved [Eimeria tenella]|uniref:Uncharacterized protein n=1 Tax=Eimeria tenella TaxID=5802 RepID=U6KJQ7_EIMTE|nr:hypothetical protein, conserved [Eimeria tenella]CDJ38265.1 hypothetical protein, conserved [Eimeria tenella]|eukprot:XP_013229103.1 hypothetical protein, conserved [Eimeria tenella]